MTLLKRFCTFQVVVWDFFHQRFTSLYLHGSCNFVFFVFSRSFWFLTKSSKNLEKTQTKQKKKNKNRDPNSPACTYSGSCNFANIKFDPPPSWVAFNDAMNTPFQMRTSAIFDAKQRGGGGFNPSQKYARQITRKDRSENNKIFELPPPHTCWLYRDPYIGYILAYFHNPWVGFHPPKKPQTTRFFGGLKNVTNKTTGLSRNLRCGL